MNPLDDFQNEDLHELLLRLRHDIDRLGYRLEKLKLAEYVEMLEHPRRLLWSNFIQGVARGLGIAVGVTILGAVILYFLQRLLLLNIPMVGGFIAQIVTIVQEELSHYSGIR